MYGRECQELTVVKTGLTVLSYLIFMMYDPKTTIYFMKLYERLLMNHRSEEAERKRKAEERKAKSGGKNYTHNVQG